MKKAALKKEATIRESYANKWNDTLLQPFTPQRSALALEMGMTWPLIKEEDKYETNILHEGKKVKFFNYRQSFKDSIIALWVCLQFQERIDDAERDLSSAKTECWAWAEREEIKPGSERAGLAYAALMGIISQMLTTQGKPIPKEGEDNDTGEV